MPARILKKLNSIIPDPLKMIAAPIIRKKLIGNEIFKQQYEELRAYERLSEDEKNKKQYLCLKKTLVHAYEHTVYYKKLFDECGFNPNKFTTIEQLDSISILTKQIIRNNWQYLQADDIVDYYYSTTGGSTGSPLKVSLDSESIYRERAFVYYFWSKYGYNYGSSKVASFRGTDFHGKNFKMNPVYDEVQCNPCNINEHTVEDYYNKIEQFGATFLHGFPSAIYSYSKFAEKAGLKIKGKYKAVFCISENLYDFQKQYIESTLDCPVAPFYGHTERAVFAEYLGNGYYFDRLYGYIELSKLNNIICTGFINRKMPLIRYVLDDTAIDNGEHYEITGHRNGFLYGINGEVISAAALEVHSTLLDKIASYQFRQDRKGEVEISYIPLDSIKNSDIESLRDLFQEKIGEAAHVTLKSVKELEHTNRGKCNLIIQNIH